jgi:hypothetical protein
MLAETAIHKRNLFEIENARNLTREELIQTFVPTQSFWRLLSAKHHVILGSRGSGKTAIAKMLSHDHLSRFNEDRAQSAIGTKAFLGIYVPTRLEWVGGLKNKPWQSEREKEEFFQWRLNLSSCAALLATLRSCVDRYIEGDPGDQARAERELSLALSESWTDNGQALQTFRDLHRHLQDTEFRKHQQLARLRSGGESSAKEPPVGLSFDCDLFVPLRRGITLASRVLDIREDSAWLVCLDEAEFLEESHHRIFNSHMRAYPENLYFKVTTMPYCHYTLATNAGVSLDVGHDFEYVYIDTDPVLYERTLGESGRIGTQFARKLFSKRADASGLIDRQQRRGQSQTSQSEEELQPFTVKDLLGRSELLDPAPSDWRPGSRYMNLLEKYGSTETIARARNLLGSKRFMPAIGRKIQGALLLREAKDLMRGNQEADVYSGATMAIRCGDANPRRLIRIFNSLLLVEWNKVKRGRWLSISPKDQTRALRKLSTSTLVRVNSEPLLGPDLYNFLRAIGEYMQSCLFDHPVTTDQVSSIKVDNDVSDLQWELIKRAVGLGLLFPNVGPSHRDEMPNREGVFHLAYVLAPHFFILPRRGKYRSLSTIIKFQQDLGSSRSSERTNSKEQIGLFSWGPTDES